MGRISLPDKEIVVFTAILLMAFIVLLKKVIKKKICKECGEKLKVIKIVGKTETKWSRYANTLHYGPKKEITYKFICEKCNREYTYEEL